MDHESEGDALMIVEQAVFASANTRTISGYHLVAKSPGVSEALASELVRWAPTKSAMASDDENFESLNSFVVIGDRIAISRTLYGRPEYSKRGDLETSTRFLVAPLAELDAYDNNPLWFLRTAMTLGHLRLYIDDGSDLAPIEFPDHALFGVRQSPTISPVQEPALAEATRKLQLGERVAIVGHPNEVEALGAVLERLDSASRAKLTFTTGLLPSGVRPFRLHFLTRAALEANSRLSTHELAYVAVEEDSPVA